MTTIASVITAARRQCGWTQTELASRLNISKQYMNDIEQGNRHPENDEFLDKLAYVLDLSLDYLYFLCGRIPPDIRSSSATPEQVISAFLVLQRMLSDQSAISVQRVVR